MAVGRADADGCRHGRRRAARSGADGARARAAAVAARRRHLRRGAIPRRATTGSASLPSTSARCTTPGGRHPRLRGWDRRAQRLLLRAAVRLASARQYRQRIGLDRPVSLGTSGRPGMVRLSFGAYNTLAEIDAAIDAIAARRPRRLRGSLSFRHRSRRLGASMMLMLQPALPCRCGVHNRVARGAARSPSLGIARIWRRTAGIIAAWRCRRLDGRFSARPPAR